ncbi:hypothetical protein [Microterricola pindariensis]|uniref:DUF5134 domain-containing protein n=1 Tax=Microterricola pindariensis TaxID=478010 RepID=A0ABX5ASP4_9MICO|nr:hypothetical protein [Microterricola pindariensis]PPL15708.1 hypothetical protein GY24_13820 [Microterricola pindariensis]
MLAVICLGGAVLLTVAGLGSAGAARMRRPRLGASLLPAGLMAASTVAMVLPTLLPGIGPGATGSPLGWAALLLAAALLGLLDRRHRLESAMTAGSGLIMAAMWLAMAAAVQRPPSAGGQLTAHLHLGAEAAPFAAVLAVGAVIVAAAHTALALYLCRRQAAAARGIRIATLHHPAMSLGMLLMGLGMLA